MEQASKDNDNNHLDLKIQAVTVFKIALVAILIIIAWQFIANIMPIILLIVMASLLAIALNPFIEAVQSLFKIKKRTLAIGITFVLITIFLVALIAVVIPPIFSQISQAINTLPQTITDFLAEDNWLSRLIINNGLDASITEAVNNLSSVFKDNLDSLLLILQTISSAIIGLILVFVVAFMMLAEGSSLAQRFKKYTSKEVYEKWRVIYRDISNVIINYINGQVLLALLGGLVTFVILSIISSFTPLPGNYSSVAMAAIVTVASLVPFIGVVVGYAIVIALTMLVDVNLGLALGICLILYQILENFTIQPVILHNRKYLSTFQILIATIIGFKVAGVIGILLSVPLAGCIKVIASHYLNSHRQQLEAEYKKIRRSVRLTKKPKKSKS